MCSLPRRSTATTPPFRCWSPASAEPGPDDYGCMSATDQARNSFVRSLSGRYGGRLLRRGIGYGIYRLYFRSSSKRYPAPCDAAQSVARSLEPRRRCSMQQVVRLFLGGNFEKPSRASVSFQCNPTFALSGGERRQKGHEEPFKIRRRNREERSTVALQVGYHAFDL